MRAIETRPEPPALGSGNAPTEHMLVAAYEEGAGWGELRLVPYAGIELDPMALVLHYGQAVFEGLKAFAQPGGGVALFRPDRHARRLRASAARMDMPGLPEEAFLKGVEALVARERAWVPDGPGTSLYLRPVMLADEAAFGVRRSRRFLAFVIATPVRSLHRPGDRPLRIRVAENHARAAPGGGGDVKAAGNYGRTILPLGEARRDGFDNLLWLDGARRELIEEVGIANVFVATRDGVVTPPLNGCILPGVTRDSALALLRAWDVPVAEREMTVSELADGLASGRVREVFATGTATLVAPVGTIAWRGREYAVPDADAPGSLAGRLARAIEGIQRGVEPDRFGWLRPVPASPGRGAAAAEPRAAGVRGRSRRPAAVPL